MENGGMASLLSGLSSYLRIVVVVVVVVVVAMAASRKAKFPFAFNLLAGRLSRRRPTCGEEELLCNRSSGCYLLALAPQPVSGHTEHSWPGWAEI